MAQTSPTPAFSTPLPPQTAAKIRSTGTPRRTSRRLAALVLATGVLGGAFSVALPAGEAQAMRNVCWYEGWFKEGGIWYYGEFSAPC